MACCSDCASPLDYVRAQGRAKRSGFAGAAVVDQSEIIDINYSTRAKSLTGVPATAPQPSTNWTLYALVAAVGYWYFTKKK